MKTLWSKLQKNMASPAVHRWTQPVLASICSVDHPRCFFDPERLLRPSGRGWRIVSEWPTFDPADIAAEYRGLALERVGL